MTEKINLAIAEAAARQAEANAKTMASIEKMFGLAKTPEAQKLLIELASKTESGTAAYVSQAAKDIAEKTEEETGIKNFGLEETTEDYKVKEKEKEFSKNNSDEKRKSNAFGYIMSAVTGAAIFAAGMWGGAQYNANDADKNVSNPTTGFEYNVGGSCQTPEVKACDSSESKEMTGTDILELERGDGAAEVEFKTTHNNFTLSSYAKSQLDNMKENNLGFKDTAISYDYEKTCDGDWNITKFHLEGETYSMNSYKTRTYVKKYVPAVKPFQPIMEKVEVPTLPAKKGDKIEKVFKKYNVVGKKVFIEKEDKIIEHLDSNAPTNTNASPTGEERYKDKVILKENDGKKVIIHIKEDKIEENKTTREVKKTTYSTVDNGAVKKTTEVKTLKNPSIPGQVNNTGAKTAEKKVKAVEYTGAKKKVESDKEAPTSGM